jgi:histidyl-tRNA synthetase
MAQMGGKPSPACGWAMGMERVIELMKEQGLASDVDSGCDVYVLHQAGDTLEAAMVVAERLRSAGIEVILHCAPDGGAASFKSQMKKADSSGAAYAIIIGPDELQAGQAQLKDLRRDGQQMTVAMDGLVDAVIDQLVAISE